MAAGAAGIAAGLSVVSATAGGAAPTAELGPPLETEEDILSYRPLNAAAECRCAWCMVLLYAGRPCRPGSQTDCN